MREHFLHYLWQYQLFNKKELQTTTGERIAIQKTGEHNHNSGPDFINSQILIDSQVWGGNVEIHLKSSDWYSHHHETDKAYDNVILHVVWEDDVAIFRKNNTPISTLELKGLVPKNILENYQDLFYKNKKWIACEEQINTVSSFIWNNWLERLYIERLERKSNNIKTLLDNSKNDWEAVLFILLAKNFGLNVNGEGFSEMAKSIPFSILRKESSNATHLEALLFGQSGLLDKPTDDPYYNKLKVQYAYQQYKYDLKKPTLMLHFFRLRPPNFPTIRLSQFANLYASKQHLFNKLMHVNHIDDFYTLLQTQTSSYWDTHYSFEKESKKRTKKITKSFIDLLLINTIIPLSFFYQKYFKKEDIESILRLIKQINPEENTTIKKFKKLKLNINNALDSQSLLELKTKYCKPQLCLNCKIGVSLLNKKV